MYEFLDYQVRDVMSAPVTLPGDASLAKVEELLEERGFNGIPIVDERGALCGWVTSLDLLRAFDFSEDEILPPYERVMERSVESVMQRDVLAVTPRAPLTRVLEKLVDTRCRSLPVLDGEEVVGVVARGDVMRALRKGCRGEAP